MMRRAGLLKLLVSGGLIWLLFCRIGWRPILAAITGADGGWLAAALLTILMSNLLGSQQWRVLLRLAGVPFYGVLIGLEIEGVVEVAAELDGDAERLLDALRGRKDSRLSGYRSKAADDLGRFFLEQGHTDDRPILDESAIVERSRDLKIPIHFVAVNGGLDVLSAGRLSTTPKAPSSL